MKQHSTKNPHPFDRQMGKNLKELRAMYSITQSELADILEITFQQVQKYENGTNRLSTSNIGIICNHFDISESVLFKGITVSDNVPEFSKSALDVASKFEKMTAQEKSIIKSIIKNMEK